MKKQNKTERKKSRLKNDDDLDNRNQQNNNLNLLILCHIHIHVHTYINPHKVYSNSNNTHNLTRLPNVQWLIKKTHTLTHE